MVPGKIQTMPIVLMTHLRARCRACGFTLVELMVTLAVAAILAMIAVPPSHGGERRAEIGSGERKRNRAMACGSLAQLSFME